MDQTVSSKVNLFVNYLNYNEGDDKSTGQTVWIGISSKPFNPDAYCHTQPKPHDPTHFAYGYGNRQKFKEYGEFWEYLDTVAFKPGDKLCIVLNLKKEYFIY